jgi:hypothetical protein
MASNGNVLGVICRCSTKFEICADIDKSRKEVSHKLQRKGEKFRARSLALSTLKGLRGVLELRDGTRKSDKQFIHSLGSASNQPQVG